jgi:DUF2946 family protein
VKSRRLFSIVAILAVAWGALWPLVSTAMPKSTITVVVCTQSGFQQHVEIPGPDHTPKFHCPLCVLAIDAAPAEMAAPRVFLDVEAAQPAGRSIPAFHREFAARPPPSRAPPHLS